MDPIQDHANTILDGAISILKEDGWIQGSFENYAGACCLVGALHYAAGSICVELGVRVEGRQLAARRLQGVIGTPFIALWNDARGRTATEVIAALEKAKIP